jgi:glycosyltransferase involved in cell wall biosynthesis
MKVAYINCLLSPSGEIGVETKLCRQAKAISLLGIDMDVCYINFKQQLKGDRVVFHRRPDGPLHKVSSMLFRYTSIEKYIDTDKYDLLVLRYSGGDCSALSPFFRRNGKKVVTEHHTKELDEAFTSQSIPIQKALSLSMERYLGPKLIKGCRGLIGVTDEIRQYELQRAGNRLPACTIPNGVLVQDIPFSKHGTYNGSILKLVCLANAFQVWQGLDRVLAGLKQYTSRRPFLHLKVVGHVPPRSLNGIDRLDHHSNVKVDFLGRLYGADLEEVLGEAHVAFSSLALFRKGMKEACALKTREFVARGLPLVVGYRDPDFQDTEVFLLPIAPNNSPVDIDQVVTFAERVLTQKGLCGYMREYAEERLDWNAFQLGGSGSS